ncbi:hypothetical protein JK635_16030 [Neobacillus sp. YIM B02564]|uniref:Uncharacterized protein n=1 Tax=Neobacillus paridis TaxID=2803862 RepID=A0ABS1TT32_9BACI|nr:hypothetical protein [Neobacillus paridis]MBL4953698.1 hypothetical protein [Neobacillus paridis]
MRQRKSALAIINQGLSAVWAGLLEKERERLLVSNGSVEFRLVTANGACHNICGRNCICFNLKQMTR